MSLIAQSLPAPRNNVPGRFGVQLNLYSGVLRSDTVRIVIRMIGMSAFSSDGVSAS